MIPLLRLPRLTWLISIVVVANIAIALPAAAEDRPLRLVTFNMLHAGPWSRFTGEELQLEARLGLTIAGLRALDPDVVALQESSITRRGDVAERIGRALGLRHVHVRATERVFPLLWLGRLIVWALDFVEGPAILSRFPIVTSEVHDLPRCRRRLDPRVALQADIETPSGVVAVFSTHTSRDDCQTCRVAELAARSNRRAAIVMGDLNTTESMPGLDAFREHGFVDLFRAANPEALGPTVWQRIDASAPTALRRIDYVLVRAGGGREAVAVSARVVLDTPGTREDGGALWPSDHYGVFAEVALRRASGR